MKLKETRNEKKRVKITILRIKGKEEEAVTFEC